MEKINYDEIIFIALEARKNAYTPYSNFKVGAALLTKNGKIYKGCNIESVSYSPTNCAERTAFFKAVSENERDFLAIAVVGGFENKELEHCYPCGVCRQVMLEFCNPKEFEVVIVKDEKDFKVYKLDELIPFGFSPAELQSRN